MLVPPNRSVGRIDRETLHRELSSLAKEDTIEYELGIIKAPS